MYSASWKDAKNVATSFDVWVLSSSPACAFVKLVSCMKSLLREATSASVTCFILNSLNEIIACLYYLQCWFYYYFILFELFLIYIFIIIDVNYDRVFAVYFVNIFSLNRVSFVLRCKHTSCWYIHQWWILQEKFYGLCHDQLDIN